MTYAVTVHNRLDAISAEWPRGGSSAPASLASPAPPRSPVCHVFQTATFLKVLLDSFGAKSPVQPRLVEVRDISGGPVLFLPLCITVKGGLRTLGFIDAGSADYNAPILFAGAGAGGDGTGDRNWTAASAAELWRVVLAALDPVDIVLLDKMPEKVAGLVNPLQLLSDAPNDVSCHATDLRRPFAEIEKALPNRKTMFKKMRSLERMAPTAFVIAQTPQERGAIIARLLAQKQQRFEETMVPGFDANPEKQVFFLEGTEVFAQAGMLFTAALKVGDEMVSTLWGLTQGKRFYGIMIAFDGEVWGKYSVGRIVYYRTLQWLHGQGYEIADSGIGDEPWKIEHCDITIPLFKKTVIVTRRGRFYMQRIALLERFRATAVWQRLRPMKWVVLRAFRRKAGPPVPQKSIDNNRSQAE